MNIVAMLMPVLLALTPSQATAGNAPSTSTDTDILRVYLTSIDNDERTEEQKYRDQVAANKKRLKEATSLKLMDDGTSVSKTSEPLIPGKVRLRVNPKQVKLVWKTEQRNVELRAKESFVGLNYSTKFSLNSLFD